MVNRNKPMITIEDFWRIDDLIKAKWGRKFYQYIDYCGLEPVRPLVHDGYFCTPKNTLTFATTGGNGVHFGIITDTNSNETSGPIVMTVPMADTKNVVVAEDLNEFFSLGYYVGWFALEEIVYDLDETVDYFSKPDKEITQEKNAFLEIIRKEFTVHHIPLSKVRLDELEKTYLSILEIDNE